MSFSSFGRHPRDCLGRTFGKERELEDKEMSYNYLILSVPCPMRHFMLRLFKRVVDIYETLLKIEDVWTCLEKSVKRQML